MLLPRVASRGHVLDPRSRTSVRAGPGNRAGSLLRYESPGGPPWGGTAPGSVQPRTLNLPHSALTGLDRVRHVTRAVPWLCPQEGT